MEDAAIHELNIGDGNSLFAVFDGHGGILLKIFRLGSE
jgi:serine/threonine protein phosphatase PrpC